MVNDYYKSTITGDASAPVGRTVLTMSA